MLASLGIFFSGSLIGAFFARFLSKNQLSNSDAYGAATRTRQQIDAILSHLPAILWSVDGEGNFTHYDAKASAISGKLPVEMIGRNVFELFSDDEVSLRHIRLALDGEASRYVSQVNGIEIETDIAPLYDKHGHTCGAAGVSFDITARTAQEHRGEKWEAIFRSASWGICVTFPNGKISRVNAAFTRLFGETPEFWRGRPLLETFAEEFRPMMPAKFAEIDAAGYSTYSSPRLRSNGTVFPSLSHVSAIRDASGKLLFRVGNIFDLTEQKKTETDLASLLKEKNVLLEEATRAHIEGEETVRRLQAALKEIDEIKFALHQSSIVATTDSEGRINFANDNFCRISQYSRAELIGHTYGLVNSGYHSAEFKLGLKNTIEGGNVWRGEIKCRAKDGSIFWIDTSVVPVLDEAGKPAQYISICTDITAKKQMEETQAVLAVREHAAVEASRLKNVFLANVSHEIRTPINGVIGMARLLERDTLEQRQA